MKLPHVTGILKDAGVVDDRWFTDLARDRGTALHRACELLDQDDLDEDTVAPEVREGLERYKTFLREVRPEILSIEERVEYPDVYCGTLDRRVRIQGAEGVLDIKGQPSPSHPLQLAGYAACFDRPMRRWNLYLRDGPRYRLIEHKNRRRDDAVWRACVTLAAWRKEHGI